MLRWIRLATYATIPFLIFSGALLGGVLMTTAFVAEFTITNHTSGTLFVTPVGTVGAVGFKRRLPIVWHHHCAMPSHTTGDFRLAPGKSIAIEYDMDDINFSEIVVDDGSGPRRQLVVNPSPTLNRYRAPRQRLIVIDNVTKLPLVAPAVDAAALNARPSERAALIFYAVIFLPWIVLALLSLANRKLTPRQPLPLPAHA